MKVLAGDLGGTKTVLQVIDCDHERFATIAEQRYPSSDYDGLHTITKQFFVDVKIPPQTLHAACFGVAGPVSNNPAGFQTATITNLPWELHSLRLSDAIGIDKVKLINDFRAIGYGLSVLNEQDLIELQAGLVRPQAPRALIGAGTGLGTGFLVWQDGHYEVFPAEGGHTDFAPNDALQAELLAHLSKRFGHVSYERVVSGAGLVNIFSFLVEHLQSAPSEALSQAMAHSDPAAAISEFAVAERDPLAEQALAIFVQIYGHCAGNLALHYLARGGLFVAGGIAPKIAPKLADGAFISAFCDKGRMSELNQMVPVYVVKNPAVGVLGAGLAASRL